MQQKLSIFAFLVGLLLLSCAEEKSPKTAILNYKDYSLTVSRGAFHEDTFIMNIHSLRYLVPKDASFEDTKYTVNSITPLDSLKTIAFFKELEVKGIWNLENNYKSDGSCTSSLLICFKNTYQTKTISCDDFQRDCPELLQYVEQKMVELEGSNLKRSYLPG